MDERVPEHRNPHASSSHEVTLEPTSKRRENLGKQCLYSFPKKTEIARSVRGPKITRAHSAEDAMAKPYLLLSADHKVLNDNCESRNNHRYAVVVQDLGKHSVDEHDNFLLFATRSFHSTFEHFFCHTRLAIRVFESLLDKQRESALFVAPRES